MAVVTGLAGVLIFTTPERFGAMRGFYVDVLGLLPRSDRAEFVSFEWGPVRLTVAVHSAIRGAAGDPLRIMLNLSVDDIHAAVARAEAAGARVLRGPERESWGGWVGTVSDPDGNTVQFLQFPVAGNTLGHPAFP